MLTIVVLRGSKEPIVYNIVGFGKQLTKERMPNTGMRQHLAETEKRALYRIGKNICVMTLTGF
jgi:tRNA A-37 threonylcarbamoyl transferase component Bud32